MKLIEQCCNNARISTWDKKDRDSSRDVICNRLFILIGFQLVVPECLSRSDPQDGKEEGEEKSIGCVSLNLILLPQLYAHCNKIFVSRFCNAARVCAMLLNRANKLMLPGEQEARSAHSAHFCKKPIVNMLPC